jgi:hypothetical protein
LLELIRPGLILLSLRDENLSRRELLAQAFRRWLPYLGTILLVVLYRSLVYSHPGFGYSLTEELARAPVETSIGLLQRAAGSLWVAVVAAWGLAFELPDPAVNGIRSSALYALVVGMSAGVALLAARRAAADAPEARRDAAWLLGLGAAMLMLGGAAYWATNLPVTLGFPANRATLSFMFGACFVLVGLLELLPARLKYLLAITLVALSAGRQFLWSLDYARAWQSQKTLFWQMVWRAPGLTPGTVVLMNEELDFNADNSLSAALEWIYAPEARSEQIQFVLFYPTNRLGKSLPALEPGVPIRYAYWGGVFESSTSQAVAMYYSPPGCLHVLDPELDTVNRFILAESMMREAAALSSTAPILSEPLARLPALYGPEPAHGWCYHFQKADLARQLGDWETVAELGDRAFVLDDYPNDPTERFVFIEGYAHTGNWDTAFEYSQVAHRVSPAYVDPLLCRLWARIEAETASSPERNAVLEEVRMNYACSG